MTFSKKRDSKTDKEKSVADHSRRKVLKQIGIGAGVAAGVAALPTAWTSPLMEMVIVPAHAQTSTSPTTTPPPTTTSAPSCNERCFEGIATTGDNFHLPVRHVNCASALLGQEEQGVGHIGFHYTDSGWTINLSSIGSPLSVISGVFLPSGVVTNFTGTVTLLSTSLNEIVEVTLELSDNAYSICVVNAGVA